MIPAEYEEGLRPPALTDITIRPSSVVPFLDTSDWDVGVWPERLCVGDFVTFGWRQRTEGGFELCVTGRARAADMGKLLTGVVVGFGFVDRIDVSVSRESIERIAAPGSVLRRALDNWPKCLYGGQDWRTYLGVPAACKTAA